MSILNKFRKWRGKTIDSLPYPMRRYLIYRYRLKVPKYISSHKRLISNIKKACYAKVLFVVSSMSMWKYDEIFKILISDPRFNVKIIVYPFYSYSEASKAQSINQIVEYFSSYKVELFNAYNQETKIARWIDSFNPDIMFYQLPYEGIYKNDLESYKYFDKLICYTPYGVSTAEGGSHVDTIFHNVAWKIFTATKVHYKMAYKKVKNRGENMVIVGESNANRFNDKTAHFNWKHEKLKKIIWAPHYSITSGNAFHRTGFLWLSEFMLSLPKQTGYTVQVAFKPHPKLKTMLYEHPDWGKEITDKYFSMWENGDFTQLCEGEYAALFATSDAMIHDSSSFIGEYMYTKKPVLFTSTNLDSVRKECNTFGNLCLDLHYKATNVEEIREFVNSVVIGGDDRLKPKREDFFEKVLEIKDGLTPGARIYKTILDAFGWSN